MQCDLSDLRLFYANGMCSVLAVVVHERTGWPICGFYLGPDGRPGFDAPVHFACRAPDGTFSDARGTGRSLEEIVAEYGLDGRRELLVHEVSVEEVMSLFRRHQWNYAIAREEHLDLLLPDLDGAAVAEMAFSGGYH